MKVITVFKTHVDIGFTDLPLAVLSRYAGNMLANAIETCERTRDNPKGERFVWTLPAYPLYYALERTTPEMKNRAEALIKDGQLTWHALPFTLRTEFFSKEELTDSFLYSKRLAKRYEVQAPRSAKMTDVPGHTQVLVDVLVENGIRFLHLGSNPAVTRPNVPTLFWWESISGNRILTYYNKDYGSEITPPKDWEFPVHLALIQSNDNCGVQPPEVISSLKENAQKNIPGAEFTVGTLDDFADEILECDLSRLPVIRGELGDSWIFALGHWHESVAAVLEGRRAVNAVRESLSQKEWESLLPLYEKYLESTLLFGEHSGGVDTKRYLSKRYYKKDELSSALLGEEYLYAKKGWDQERAFAFDAKNAALALKEEAVKRFGIKTESSSGTTECKRYSLSLKDDKICITDNENGVCVLLSYEYEAAGKGRIDAFLDEYLTRKFDWAFEDFGRKNYPECDDFYDTLTLKSSTVSESKITATYESVDQRCDFGQAKSVSISATISECGVTVGVKVLGKEPTLYAEAGHLVFDFGKVPTSIGVQKSSCVIDPSKDIVLGAPTNVFCAEKVFFDQTEITPHHSPLVSFGRSEFYRFCCKEYQKPESGKIYFTLFSNQLGTGSPQWLVGDINSEFIMCDRTSKL